MSTDGSSRFYYKVVIDLMLFALNFSVHQSESRSDSDNGLIMRTTESFIDSCLKPLILFLMFNVYIFDFLAGIKDGQNNSKGGEDFFHKV